MAVGKKNLWLKRCLKSGDLERIQMAVKIAESKTTGEIVPMLVQRSTPVGHLPVVLALIGFVFFLLLDLEWIFHSADQRYFWLIPGFFILSFLLAIPIAKFLCVQRWLTSKTDQEVEVWEKAELEFYRGRFTETSKHTAILLFVSLMERKVVVLADKGISSKLPPETWKEVVQLLTTQLKQKKLALGYVNAIEKCGQILAQYFPAEAHDKNEIPNGLVVRD